MTFELTSKRCVGDSKDRGGKNILHRTRVSCGELQILEVSDKLFGYLVGAVSSLLQECLPPGQ